MLSRDFATLRSWSVPSCGGDGAVVVHRQVTSDGELGLPVCLEKSLVRRRAVAKHRACAE